MLTFKQYCENFLQHSQQANANIQRLALELFNKGIGQVKVAAQRIEMEYPYIPFDQIHNIVAAVYQNQRNNKKTTKSLPKDCSKCKVNKAVKGFRFCQDCMASVKDDIKNYLEPKPKGHKFRPKDSQEDIYGTKYGWY